jgi:hypothetical protein
MQLANELMDATTGKEREAALEKFRKAFDELDKEDVLKAGEEVRDLVAKAAGNPRKARKVAAEIDRQLKALRQQ